MAGVLVMPFGSAEAADFAMARGLAADLALLVPASVRELPALGREVPASVREVVALGRLAVALDLVVPAAGRELAARVVLPGDFDGAFAWAVPVPGPALETVTAGFTADMLLAAAASALDAAASALDAAVMALAAFMAASAPDMVLAEVVALVAAVVILVAAEVTLAAAEETVRAAAVAPAPDAAVGLVALAAVVLALLVRALAARLVAAVRLLVAVPALDFGLSAVRAVGLVPPDLARAPPVVPWRAGRRVVVCTGIDLPRSDQLMGDLFHDGQPLTPAADREDSR
ncbi:MAG TPA: hypothetical protein VGS19_36420 [Streptosporangiaceae bacterium]|nr:hypothetical protein [Streptosporangiaceae bacterium]